jgi:hypothetical protein
MVEILCSALDSCPGPNGTNSLFLVTEPPQWLRIHANLNRLGLTPVEKSPEKKGTRPITDFWLAVCECQATKTFRYASPFSKRHFSSALDTLLFLRWRDHSADTVMTKPRPWAFVPRSDDIRNFVRQLPTTLAPSLSILLPPDLSQISDKSARV